jgi:hypothetical protein
MTLTIENFKILLEKNQKAKIKIASDSMWPLIRIGEQLTVHSINRPLQRFDIIVFNYNGSPFCHFFWGKLLSKKSNEDQFFTRSLKSPAQTDLPIFSKDILGIITSKKIGFFLRFRVYLYLLLRINGT